MYTLNNLFWISLMILFVFLDNLNSIYLAAAVGIGTLFAKNIGMLMDLWKD